MASSLLGNKGDKLLVEELGQSLFAVIGGKPTGFASIKAKLFSRKPTVQRYRTFLEEDGLDAKEIAASLENQIVAVRCSRQVAQKLWPSLAEKCSKKVKILRKSAYTKSPNVAQGSLVAMKGSTTWCIGGFVDQWECQSAGREIVSEAKRKVQAGNRDFYVSRPSAVFDDLEKKQRLEKLFPSVKDRSKLQIDEEAAYSVSNEASAATVAQIAKKAAGLNGSASANVVIDATACVGGNTLAFARLFDKVIAIEIDAKRVKFLKGNIQHLRKEEEYNSWVTNKISANLRVIHGDCLRVLPRILCEMHAERVVVFADPPWGGRYYRVQPVEYAAAASTESTADVHLKGSGGLVDLVQACVQHACVSILILKVPASFDHQTLVRDFSCFSRHDVYDWDLMKLIVVHLSQRQEHRERKKRIRNGKRRRPTGAQRKRKKRELAEMSAADDNEASSPISSGQKKRRKKRCRNKEMRLKDSSVQPQFKKAHDRALKKGKNRKMGSETGGVVNNSGKGEAPSKAAVAAGRLWGYFDNDWHKCILVKTKSSGKHKVLWKDGTISILDADCIEPRVKRARHGGDSCL